MSTGFYDLDGRRIGTRTAGGLYCWDCGVSMALKWGNMEECPRCGRGPEKEADLGAAGRELGFNKSKPKRKVGVRSCSVFGWLVWPWEVKWRRRRVLGRRVIKDEYGREYTRKEFKAVLSECPMVYYDRIGDTD